MNAPNISPKPEVKPAPTVKKVKERKFPPAYSKEFSQSEQALYLKSKKELTVDEAKALIAIHQKMAMLKAKAVVLKVQEAPRNRKVAFGKCVFAETILKKKPDLLKEIVDTEFSPEAVEALGELCKIYKVDVKYKSKAKK